MNPETYYTERKNKFLDKLCEYLRFRSISAQAVYKKDIEACAEWIASYCEGIGLNTQIFKTERCPIILASSPVRRPGKKKVLIYGHYDVQPPEPLDLWKSPPFEPQIINNAIYARGASDNKGQHFAHLLAVESFLGSQNEAPCDVIFLLEGEEEVGSQSLTKFLREHKDILNCDCIVVSDSGMPARNLPALTYALRGVVALELIIKGPSHDLHSGVYGGAIENPAYVLCKIIAGLKDDQGRITIPGIYDDVRPLSAEERLQLARLPFSEDEFKKQLGVVKIFGESGFTTWERRAARPTIEINGITSGYQGEGSKTIIPSVASAKITLRIVPDQRPERVYELVRKHIEGACPDTVTLSIVPGHMGEAYITSYDSVYSRAAIDALRKAYGVEPVLMREGGSVPIVTEFKKILGVDSLLIGMALPDDNPHSPNEKFDIDSFYKGIEMSMLLLEEIGKI